MPTSSRNIVIKNDPKGGSSGCRDVARVELGAQSYDQRCTLNGKALGRLVALSTARLECAGDGAADQGQDEGAGDPLSHGIEYSIVYDTTPFINESINEVFKTLLDAVILVADRRAGVLAKLAIGHHSAGRRARGHRRHVRRDGRQCGFSLNNLTLFGLVLAIGIVVDDAIVVVEAVEHHIEHGLSPRDASIRAMEQVSGPVVAVGLVLSAVFVPCAFITGITGQFFRQFALDDRRFDGDLGVQFADAQPGPWRRCCSSRA